MQTSHPVLLSPFIYLVIYWFPSLFCKMDLSPFFVSLESYYDQGDCSREISATYVLLQHSLDFSRSRNLSRHESTSISDREF